MYPNNSAQVEAPLGEGAMMTALRPFRAIITLLAGVAAGLMDGVTAPTTPTGLAICVIPFPSSTPMTPTDLAVGSRRSRNVPSVLRWFLTTLSSTFPSPVSSTATRASSSARSCSMIAHATAWTTSFTRSWSYPETLPMAALARETSPATTSAVSNSSTAVPGVSVLVSWVPIDWHLYSLSTR